MTKTSKKPVAVAAAIKKSTTKAVTDKKMVSLLKAAEIWREISARRNAMIEKHQKALALLNNEWGTGKWDVEDASKQLELTDYHLYWVNMDVSRQIDGTAFLDKAEAEKMADALNTRSKINTAQYFVKFKATVGTAPGSKIVSPAWQMLNDACKYTVEQTWSETTCYYNYGPPKEDDSQPTNKKYNVLSSSFVY